MSLKLSHGFTNSGQPGLSNIDISEAVGQALGQTRPIPTSPSSVPSLLSRKVRPSQPLLPRGSETSRVPSTLPGQRGPGYFATVLKPFADSLDTSRLAQDLVCLSLWPRFPRAHTTPHPSHPSTPSFSLFPDANASAKCRSPRQPPKQRSEPSGSDSPVRRGGECGDRKPAGCPEPEVRRVQEVF